MTTVGGTKKGFTFVYVVCAILVALCLQLEVSLLRKRIDALEETSHIEAIAVGNVLDLEEILIKKLP